MTVEETPVVLVRVLVYELPATMVWVGLSNSKVPESCSQPPLKVKVTFGRKFCAVKPTLSRLELL